MSPEARLAVMRFAQAILHGDDEHKDWLTQAAAAYVWDLPVPAVRDREKEIPTTWPPDLDDYKILIKKAEKLAEVEARLNHLIGIIEHHTKALLLEVEMYE